MPSAALPALGFGTDGPAADLVCLLRDVTEKLAALDARVRRVEACCPAVDSCRVRRPLARRKMCGHATSGQGTDRAAAMGEAQEDIADLDTRLRKVEACYPDEVKNWVRASLQVRGHAAPLCRQKKTRALAPFVQKRAVARHCRSVLAPESVFPDDNAVAEAAATLYSSIPDKSRNILEISAEVRTAGRSITVTTSLCAMPAQTHLFTAD